MTQAPLDPVVAITVAAGTSSDPSVFWEHVAATLSAWAGGARVTTRFGAKMSVRTVDTGGSGGATKCEAHWADDEGREVTVIVRSEASIPPTPTLQTIVGAAGELSKLVERRMLLEHDRRLGSFLVELSRWMLASATDPRTLLRYALRSVMQLVHADGALVLTRGAGAAAMEVAGAEGSAAALVSSGSPAPKVIWERVVGSAQPSLSIAGEGAGDAFRSSMAVPLKATSGILGALCVLRAPRQADPVPFTLDELSYLDAVASHIAAALELAEAVRAAQGAARRARAMVDGSPLPLALVEPTGFVAQVNDAFLALVGLERDHTPVGKSLESLPLEFVGEPVSQVMTEAGTGIPWRGRVTVNSPRGPRTCDGVVTAVSTADQELLVALYDRTDELRAQRELVAREKLATVGELATGVAHEVNNPLTAIRMEAELMGRSADEKDRQESVAVILREVDRAARIARSLLHLTRRSRSEAASTSVNDVLQDVVEVRARITRSAGIEMLADLVPDLPPVFAVAGDLQQVFINLVTNAEHAVQGRPGARIEVASRLVGDLLTVTVSDSGPGVPPADRTRIFDPFFTTKDPDEGTGLGLALSRSIIAELGGRIWVEDGPLGGACFVVELPIRPHP